LLKDERLSTGDGRWEHKEFPTQEQLAVAEAALAACLELEDA
jgi:hypothetical protein